MSELTPPRVVALLCDAAQESGGKLYVLGGGWSRVWGGGPYTMALAIKIFVPWHEANEKKILNITLMTADGKPVLGPNKDPLKVEGEFEAGRPPGLRHGTDLDVPLAVTFAGLALDPGGYRWEVSIDNQLVTTVPFEVLRSPPGTPSPR